MTDGIEVRILSHNCYGQSVFLAKLTQRGHVINTMEDLVKLYNECLFKKPSKDLISLPHSTIKRICYITIAIVGLSTKAVSQLRTHAKRLTFVSTSTQYSSYENRESNYVMPDGLKDKQIESMKNAYLDVHVIYSRLIKEGMDKDKAGYLLPQGLKKALIISGNLDDWEYVMQTRLCHRNTQEVQDICKLIYKEIEAECGKEFVVNMMPKCVNDKCPEGKFCCKRKFSMEELK